MPENVPTSSSGDENVPQPGSGATTTRSKKKKKLKSKSQRNQMTQFFCPRLGEYASVSDSSVTGRRRIVAMSLTDSARLMIDGVTGDIESDESLKLIRTGLKKQTKQFIMKGFTKLYSVRATLAVFSHVQQELVLLAFLKLLVNRKRLPVARHLALVVSCLENNCGRDDEYKVDTSTPMFSNNSDNDHDDDDGYSNGSNPDVESRDSHDRDNSTSGSTTINGHDRDSSTGDSTTINSHDTDSRHVRSVDSNDSAHCCVTEQLGSEEKQEGDDEDSIKIDQKTQNYVTKMTATSNLNHAVQVVMKIQDLYDHLILVADKQCAPQELYRTQLTNAEDVGLAHKKRLMRSMERLLSKTQCVQCRERNMSYVCAPCGHVYCEECSAGSSETCSACGEQVEVIARIYTI